ncbi:hypothetical protein RFI_00891 [Reticulomyxa filosa]|uniref:Uncharacterized protein n=1 Tax=Reticulomyxa filosa TaxID=46433 RepID=X6PD80_RETFI|nr:hypothetical protein RFI_00891 [Reticulomyxa filosa]|eukprot:ETO36171.1 hypothetical protein RFI_00891 [Reticulomyxa filosa]
MNTLHLRGLLCFLALFLMVMVHLGSYQWASSNLEMSQHQSREWDCKNSSNGQKPQLHLVSVYIGAETNKDERNEAKKKKELCLALWIQNILWRAKEKKEGENANMCEKKTTNEIEYLDEWKVETSVESKTMNKSKTLVVGNDILALPGQQLWKLFIQILESFLAMNITDQVLFTAEYQCYPLSRIQDMKHLCRSAVHIFWSEYMKRNHSGKIPATTRNESLNHPESNLYHPFWLNGGGFIGFAKPLYEMLSIVIRAIQSNATDLWQFSSDKIHFKPLNDQGLLNYLWLLNNTDHPFSIRKYIRLDYWCQLWQTMGPPFADGDSYHRVQINATNTQLIVRNRWSENNSYVHVLHLNGWGKNGRVQSGFKRKFDNIFFSKQVPPNCNLSVSLGQTTQQFGQICYFPDVDFPCK